MNNWKTTAKLADKTISNPKIEKTISGESANIKSFIA